MIKIVSKTYKLTQHCAIVITLLCCTVGAWAQEKPISNLSIYQLTSEWKTQDNTNVTFKSFKGNTLVITLIFTSCSLSCPRLVADIKNVEKNVSPHKSSNIKYVFVSIDPETDTPEVLKQFAIENKLTGNQWLLLQGTDESVREFANVVAASYKEISPINFSHSNIISVFNANGELAYQQEGFKKTNSTLVNEIIKL